jgi:hypothetical protein
MRNIYRAFAGENLKKRGYLEDPGIDGMIFKMDPKETGWEDVE